MRLRRFPVGRKDEFDQKPVLFYQAELMTVLAHDVPVAGKFPRSIGFFHQVAAVAKLGVLLDIVVVPDSQHDAQNRDNEHQADKNGLVPRGEPAFKLVEYFGNQIVHDIKIFTAEDAEHAKRKN